MENHPIPQDVTGFQFKLIGEMTIKQFAYLAAGIISAWIAFSLPIFFLFKLPFVLLFALLGIGLAFFPVEGRPMDIMLINFVKAILNPNQFIFQKVGGNLSVLLIHPKAAEIAKEAHPEKINKLATYLNTLPKKQGNKMDEREMVFLQSLGIHKTTASDVSRFALPGLKTSHRLFAPKMPQEQKDQEAEKRLEKQADFLQKELEVARLDSARQAKKEEGKPAEQTVTAQDAHGKVTQLEDQLQSVLAQKKQLEEQLVALSRKMHAPPGQVMSLAQAPAQPQQSSQVRKVTPAMGAKVGLPFMPDVPNFLLGIVKDSRGNILPNILIEVKDKDQSPVRAFKTNNLGQFASATPLQNGVYTIEFEDPAGVHTFQVVQIEATGEILAPLEIISTDAREQLRRDLFGK